MGRSLSFSRLRARFDQLAEELRRPEKAARCRRPLADWTSISDRSVPFVLLDRSVAEVVRNGFDDAAAKPGVGVKKLAGLIALLQRVAVSDEVEPLPAADPLLPVRSVFDPTAARLRHNARVHTPLREIDWDAWRRLLHQRKLVDHPIGRYLGRLRDLPAIMWRKPVRYYAGCTLPQLFALPQHGNRRVAAVADTFRRLAEASDAIPSVAVGRPPVVLRLLYRLDELQRPELVRRRSVGELRQLLLQQIESDLGPQAADVFVQLTDAKSDKTKPNGWNRHYRHAIQLLCEVRCPEIFARLDELAARSTMWPPAHHRSLLLLRNILAS
jgi:hypothetical protein